MSQDFIINMLYAYLFGNVAVDLKICGEVNNN